MPPRDRSVFFATCAPGVEPVLHEEARELGLAKLERQVGGVRFEGTLQDAWRANLELRTAVRVLRRLTRFEAFDADALHAAALEIPWERFLAPEGTLAVQAQSKESALDHTQFLEQRVKDAVVDRFRARTGARPSVDKDSPDLAIHVHLFRDRVTLSLDTSGESLHKRGWRLHQGRAPLSETLAAAVVLLSGWDRRAPFVDPFCGSGTLAIEAAWIAAGIAPGSRRSFGFERWLDHDARAFAGWRETRVAPERRARRPVMRASDLDPARVAEARANAENAGVADWIQFEEQDARELELRAGWNAWIVTNPPYGERVDALPPRQRERVPSGNELLSLFRAFGARLRDRGAGSTLALLAGGEGHARALGLPDLRRIALVNGGLACELLLGVL